MINLVVVSENELDMNAIEANKGLDHEALSYALASSSTIHRLTLLAILEQKLTSESGLDPDTDAATFVF